MAATLANARSGKCGARHSSSRVPSACRQPP
jgi:hypothetical protein